MLLARFGSFKMTFVKWWKLFQFIQTPQRKKKTAANLFLVILEDFFFLRAYECCCISEEWDEMRPCHCLGKLFFVAGFVLCVFMLISWQTPNSGECHHLVMWLSGWPLNYMDWIFGNCIYYQFLFTCFMFDNLSALTVWMRCKSMPIMTYFRLFERWKPCHR